MKTPVTGSHYGFGLIQVDTRCGSVYGGEGDFLGYRTVLYARPDASRVALVMVNVDRTFVAPSARAHPLAPRTPDQAVCLRRPHS
jgi:hypothetical protein